jgi:hypothetical protein
MRDLFSDSDQRSVLSPMTLTIPASGIVETLKRKEVTTMTYQKPELTVLGEAARLIQGSKSGGTDHPDPQTVLDCELDD